MIAAHICWPLRKSRRIANKDERIIDALQAGMPQSRIARKFHVSKTTIQEVKKTAGIISNRTPSTGELKKPADKILFSPSEQTARVIQPNWPAHTMLHVDKPRLRAVLDPEPVVRSKRQTLQQNFSAEANVHHLTHEEQELDDLVYRLELQKRLAEIKQWLKDEILESRSEIESTKNPLSIDDKMLARMPHEAWMDVKFTPRETQMILTKKDPEERLVRKLFARVFYKV